MERESWEFKESAVPSAVQQQYTELTDPLSQTDATADIILEQFIVVYRCGLTFVIFYFCNIKNLNRIVTKFNAFADPSNFLKIAIGYF